MAVMLDVTDSVDGFSLHFASPHRNTRSNSYDYEVLESHIYQTGLGTTYAPKHNMRKNSKRKEKIHGNHTNNNCSAFYLRRWWLLLVEAGPLTAALLWHVSCDLTSEENMKHCRFC